MEYELIIEKGKAKTVIAFLKQLDFVKLVPVNKKSARTKKTLDSNNKSIPYFNAKSGWDVDAETLRKQSVRKNTTYQLSISISLLNSSIFYYFPAVFQ